MFCWKSGMPSPLPSPPFGAACSMTSLTPSPSLSSTVMVNDVGSFAVPVLGSSLTPDASF